MTSWSGQPGLLADCFDAKGDQIRSSMIDPSREENYEVLRKFFKGFCEKWNTQKEVKIGKQKSKKTIGQSKKVSLNSLSLGLDHLN